MNTRLVKIAVKLGFVVLLCAVGLTVGVSAQKTAKRVAKKRSSAPAVQAPVVIVAEEGVVGSAGGLKQQAETVTVAASPAYRQSLLDLIQTRATDLASAEAQQVKIEALFADGFVSKAIVEENARAIVESRARLEEARHRLAELEQFFAKPEVASSADTAIAPPKLRHGKSHVAAAGITQAADLKRTALLRARKKITKVKNPKH